MDPISPKVLLVKLPEPETPTTPLPPKLGALKFAWLKMLNISARNCMEKRSVSWKALNVEKSKVLIGGPVVVAGLPPNKAAPVAGMHPAVAGAPSGQGCWKAFGLPNQLNLLFESRCSPSF